MSLPSHRQGHLHSVCTILQSLEYHDDIGSRLHDPMTEGGPHLQPHIVSIFQPWDPCLRQPFPFLSLTCSLPTMIDPSVGGGLHTAMDEELSLPCCISCIAYEAMHVRCCSVLCVERSDPSFRIRQQFMIATDTLDKRHYAIKGENSVSGSMIHHGTVGLS